MNRFSLLIRAVILLLSFLIMTDSGLSKKVKKDAMPKPVLEAFQKSYPKAKVIEYSIEPSSGILTYQIEFKKGGKTMEAVYGQDGKLLQSEEDINQQEIPKEVITYIKANYKGYKIEEASKVLRNNKITNYDVTIKQGKHTMELEFDKTGKFLKKLEED